MSDIINLHSSAADSQTVIQSQEDAELVEIANGILQDTRSSLANRTVMTMPIAQLATLGAGVATLLNHARGLF